MSARPYRRGALGAMYVGLALTVAATIVPFVDHCTGNVLADHIRSGYPAYSPGRVDQAATTYLILLSVVGALGLVSWATTIWAVKKRRRWSRVAATAMFGIGATVALTGLLVKDTSGEVGLAPLLGWVGILPCVAGLLAVVLVWKRA